MKSGYVVLGVAAALLIGAMQLQAGRLLVGAAMVLLGLAMVLPLFEPKKAEVRVQGASVKLSGWRRTAYWLLWGAAAALLLSHIVIRA